MGEEDKRILDFKSDILTDAELFIADLEFKPDIESLKVLKSHLKTLACVLMIERFSSCIFPFFDNLLFEMPVRSNSRGSYNKKAYF